MPSVMRTHVDIVFFILFFFCLFFLSANPVQAENNQHSIFSSLVETSLMLDLTRHESADGQLIISVGERGHVLYADTASDWQQADVASIETLTAVDVLDINTAVAVGHHGQIVKTTDGGATWKQVYRSDDEAPLLDVLFNHQQQGIAIGAYGLMYISDDAGEHWQKKAVQLNDNDVFEHEPDQPFDLHLNALAYAGNDRFYIAAESGYVLRSDDAGHSWQIMTTPYPGSYFGVLALSYNELLVFGLGGNLYRSEDAGQSWQKLVTDTNAMLTNAIKLDDGRVIICGLSGTLLLSHDNGLSFTDIPTGHRHGYSAVIVNDEHLVLSGENGIELIAKP